MRVGDQTQTSHSFKLKKQFQVENYWPSVPDNAQQTSIWLRPVRTSFTFFRSLGTIFMQDESYDSQSSHELAAQQDSQKYTTEQVRTLLRSVTKSPKVIAGARKGVFELNRESLINLSNTLEQRVLAQNGCSSDRFECSVYFTDGSSVILRSFEDFVNYSETRAVRTSVVVLHWVFLITFPGRETPEKQEISLIFRRSRENRNAVDVVEDGEEVRVAASAIQITPNSKSDAYGSIAYTIDHTLTPWGLDVEGLIKQQLDVLMQKRGALQRFIDKITLPLNWLTTIFATLILSNLGIGLLFRLSAVETGSTLDAQAQYAMEMLRSGAFAKSLIASLLFAGFAIVITSTFTDFLFRLVRWVKPSTVNLSEFDKKCWTEELKSFNRRPVFIAGVILGNLAMGMISAGFYEALMQKFTSG